MICRAVPYEGSEPYIFLSYCHADRSVLYPLFEQMVMDGYRVWYDNANCAGDDWLNNIETHLEGCKAVVAFISANASMSHNCRSEITFAIKCGKRVIPILIDGSDLPKGMRMQLCSLHYLRLQDYLSIRNILNKVYECEECKSCHAPAGSLELLPKMEEQVDPAMSPPRNYDQDFWKNLTPAVPIPESIQCIPEIKDISVQNHPIEAAERNAFADNQKNVPASGTDSNPKVVEHTAHSSEASPTSCHTVQAPEDPLLHVETVYQGDTEYRNTDEPEENEDVTVRLLNKNLAILLHPASGRGYLLRKPQSKIGRSPIKCDIPIEGNTTISKYHADIIQYQNNVYLRDMNSVNGTFVNGQQLEPGEQIQLENPAIFQISDETLILLTGSLARQYESIKRVSLVVNESHTALQLLDLDDLYLNRNHYWPDNTLTDSKIHREAHAIVRFEEDGYHLVDEAPVRGNGTYLNGKKLSHQESVLLNTGDRIRLGNTTLEYFSISI